MITTFETAQCIYCKQEFKRRKGRSRPKQVCDRPNCQKIKKIKNTVATFEGFDTGSPSEYRADIDYHGRPLI